MGYALQLGAWSSVFAVPGALVDRYIKTADGDQLKVILWLLRNNGRSYSAEEIGEAVGLNGAQAERDDSDARVAARCGPGPRVGPRGATPRRS